MPLLIDGYNLLNVTGIFGRGIGPATLERSRRALLNFLAASLDPAELPQTTVVFDAFNPPPGLPRSFQHGEITVLFADRSEDADTLIEQLICEHPAPRRLTVVSSDHRLQRAARRRRAKPIDSDVWYAEVLSSRRQRNQPSPPASKPQAPLNEAEVEYWLEEFRGQNTEDNQG